MTGFRSGQEVASERAGRRIRWALVRSLLAAGCLATLAACGSGGSQTTHNTASSTAGVSHRESKSAAHMVAEAAAALRAAPSFAMHGTIIQNHQQLALRLTAIGAHTLDLSASTDGQSVRLIGLPHAAYIRANASFWRADAGARASALAGQWIEVPPSHAQIVTSSLGALAPATLSRCLSEDHGTLTSIGHAIIAGHPATLIKDAGDKPGSTPSVLAIASAGTPYPLRYTATGGQRAGGRIDVCNDGKASDARGTVTFGEFGHVPMIQAPRQAQQATPQASA
jgi:hypothetical protein